MHTSRDARPRSGFRATPTVAFRECPRIFAASSALPFSRDRSESPPPAPLLHLTERTGHGVLVQTPAAARRPHTLVLENVNPTTRLLEKRRQMFEVQDRLDEQKAEFRAEEERFKIARRRSAQGPRLQESLIRLSKFLQENDVSAPAPAKGPGRN